MCINFKKVNTTKIRDHYLLLITNHVIERLAKAKTYSFLDGFSGCYQISIDPKNQHKLAFTCKWETFTYWVMPFGLRNAPSTFQRLMCHTFKYFLRSFLEVYVDNLCVHSQHRMDYLSQLRAIFEKCQLYWLYLNPKKCVFMVRQGKIWATLCPKMAYAQMKKKYRWS